MTGAEIVSEIVSILTSGITSMASAIGEGISSIAQSVFLSGSGDTQTLSVFAILTIVFAGISLCIGLTRLIVSWVSSLGGRGV